MHPACATRVHTVPEVGERAETAGDVRGTSYYRGRMAEDVDIRQHISDLVTSERSLRERLAAGAISSDEEHEQLRRVEVELDRCWDLLRQRQALRDSGGDPDRAAARSESTVEGYLG